MSPKPNKRSWAHGESLPKPHQQLPDCNKSSCQSCEPTKQRLWGIKGIFDLFESCLDPDWWLPSLWLALASLVEDFAKCG